MKDVLVGVKGLKPVVDQHQKDFNTFAREVLVGGKLFSQTDQSVFEDPQHPLLNNTVQMLLRVASSGGSADTLADSVKTAFNLLYELGQHASRLGLPEKQRALMDMSSDFKDAAIEK